MAETVIMPQLGETVAEGKILEWFKSVGDEVKEGDNLFEVETDKVTLEVQSILSGRRCETAITPRAYAGIRALQQSRFDVVMVDIFMPGLSGLDTIKNIRLGSSVPIIAMSGFRLRSSDDAVDYLGLAAQRGATLCMRKPFLPAQLIEAIDWCRSLECPMEGSLV